MIEIRMKQVCCGIAATYGGEVDCEYFYGYPPTVNAYPEKVDAVLDAASRIVGRERTGFPQRTMGAEDMSYFLNAVPGAFFFVGAALPVSRSRQVILCVWPSPATLATGGNCFSKPLLHCYRLLAPPPPLQGPSRPHHKSVFDFSEDALLVGASVFVELVEGTLKA